jgi:hypothetical protein
MLQPIPEERATAKDLKILIKKCNLANDTIKEEIDPIPYQKNNFLKTKK